MPEDRSLDEFAPGDEDADSDAPDPTNAADDAADAADDPASDDADSDSPSGPSDAADPAAVDPAVATSTWHADGAACDRCGERVERRWRDDDAFVCADCASW